jgi:2,3-dihydroxyphenylpropionate 1,2-dioxygenase
MPIALCCMSHSPLLDLCEHDAEMIGEVDAAFRSAREFVADYDPELVVLFTPDHYNGFFYNLMPPFCLGYAASGVGDYGTASGPLDVPRETAEQCARAVLDGGIDLAVSLTMEVDHGAVQPLEKLFGDIRAKPVIPLFINSVAAPLGPVSRARLLGHAVGQFLAERPERILVIGSGGLSHDPPVPSLATATGPTAERIVSGRPMTAQQRDARTERVIDAAVQFASGARNLRELNPEWDRALLDLLATGQLDAVDAWDNAWIEQEAGGSAHEVRTWIAAYAALAAVGDYEVRYRYYRPIPELIAGFAVTTALPAVGGGTRVQGN